MKKAILIAMTLVVALAASPAHAEKTSSFNLLISGGPEENALNIKLSVDGREYIIDSLSPLEVGGAVCSHPPGLETRLLCPATAIAGFEVNAGGGNDSVIISPKIQVPATLRGGPGDDRLFGGAADDKLVGGAGQDTLIGRAGDDALYGGPGSDRLYAGSGDDVVNGGPAEDEIVGGPGHNLITQ